MRIPHASPPLTEDMGDDVERGRWRFGSTEVVFGRSAGCVTSEIGSRWGTSTGCVLVGERASNSRSARSVLAECKILGFSVKAVAPGLLTPETVRLLDREIPVGVELIVAVGGGRVLDAAKGVTYRRADATGIPPLIIAIPTTAGTGSEVTPFATVWERGSHRKRSLSAACLAPALAIVDPALSSSSPDHVAASAALDAISQAVESAWSTGSTERSLQWSLASLRLLGPGIRALEGGRRTPATWRRLAHGSLLAGAAIAVAHTTVPHAVSYFFTTRLDVAHGHAAAFLLGGLLRFNAGVSAVECTDERGHHHVLEVLDQIAQSLGAPSIEAACDVLEGLPDRLGLRPVGTLSFSSRQLAEDALSYDRARNNPRRISVEQLTDLVDARRRGRRE